MTNIRVSGSVKLSCNRFTGSKVSAFIPTQRFIHLPEYIYLHFPFFPLVSVTAKLSYSTTAPTGVQHLPAHLQWLKTKHKLKVG